MTVPRRQTTQALAGLRSRKGIHVKISDPHVELVARKIFQRSRNYRLLKGCVNDPARGGEVWSGVTVTDQDLQDTSVDSDIRTVSIVTEPNYGRAFEILQMGGSAIVSLKGCERDLLRAVEEAQKGHKWIDPLILTQIVKSSSVKLGAGENKVAAGLSNREREILKYLASGQSNMSISNLLCISQRTVKYHVSNILRKLNVRSRTEAASVYLTGVNAKMS